MSDLNRRALLTTTGAALGGALGVPAAGQPQPEPLTPSSLLPNVHFLMSEAINKQLLDKLKSPRTRLPENFAARSQKQKLIAFVEGGAEKAAAVGEAGPPAQLTPESVVVRELIRPVLFVLNRTFQTGAIQIPALKDVLEAHRAALDKAIPAVGRIEVVNHPNRGWVGTGWLVAKGVAATNRHVAAHFAAADGAGGYRFEIGVERKRIGAKVDFLEENLPLREEQPFAVQKVLHIDADYDLALLRVAPMSEFGEALAPPIELFTGDVVPKQWVAVVGYPAYDPYFPDKAVMNQIFGSVYDVKRLAPGQVMTVTDHEVQHDCSTLGGNSGSAVIDLQTGKALALHHGGAFHVANYAVPAKVVADRLAKFNR